MKHAMAPRSATWLLRCLLAEPDREAVIGDLIEEHALRQASSSGHLSWWYWNQVARSVLPLVWMTVRRGRWLGVLGAALVAFVVVTVVESAAMTATFRLFIDPVAQARASFVIGLAATALGGYVAAWIRRGAATMLAAMIALVVATMMIASRESVPLWFQLGYLILSPLASLAGGVLAPRGAARAESGPDRQAGTW